MGAVVVFLDLEYVVRNRMRPLLMVIAALAIVAVVSMLALRVARPSHTSASALLTPLTSIVAPSGSSSSVNYETIGGCAEDAHDHNHDIDPRGFVDQEDDECLPAQHSPRAPDGAPVS
ncbi:MAG: hypothetical protein ACYC1I_08910 [Acidimicrobiales bacterium]